VQNNASDFAKASTDGNGKRRQDAARQTATKDELPQKITKITKIEEHNLLSLCSLCFFAAKILFKMQNFSG
jgi:hypothetical protein